MSDTNTAATTVDLAPEVRFRWFDVLIAFVGGNLLGIALSVVVAIIAIVVAISLGQRLDQKALLGLQFDFWVNHAAIVLSDIGFAATIWLMVRRRVKRAIRHFFASTGVGAVALAILSGIAMSIVLNGGNELLERAHWVKFENTPNELALVPHDPMQFIVTLLVVGLFAPFVEEYFFRGLFFAWLKRAAGTMISVIVTALCFALLHGHLLLHPGVQGVIYTAELAVAGLVLAAWVVGTGSLTTSWATHAAYNATAILFTVLLP